MNPNTTKNLAAKVVAIGLISIFANAGMSTKIRIETKVSIFRGFTFAIPLRRQYIILVFCTQVF